MATNKQILDGLSELCELYPSKTLSEIYIALYDVILEELPTHPVQNDLLMKAINFCIDVPEFLFMEVGYDGQEYYKLQHQGTSYKIYKDDFYSFRIVGNKRKRKVFKYIWEGYSNIKEIIIKGEIIS